jgi:GNAT superfamily N-acetyltransferase
MRFREATIHDIPQLSAIRIAVKENILPNPAIVTKEDYADFLTVRGKGWVCEIENAVVGFAIIDMKEKNIWALFVHPDHEKKGVGKQLQQLMLNWYFNNNEEMVWLGTSPGTRAENFYRTSGWSDAGRRANGEIRFEMKKSEWEKQKQ